MEMVVFWRVANLQTPAPVPLCRPFQARLFKRGVNSLLEGRILNIFLPRFRIQSEVLTDLGILQLQWITDSPIFLGGGRGRGRILNFACNKIFLPGFRISDSEQNFDGGFG